MLTPRMLVSQVEALDAEGGDDEMTAADERPPKRRKGASPTPAAVPEQHRSEPTAPSAADTPQQTRAERPDGRKSRAGPSAGVREGWRRFATDLAVAERAAAAAEGGFAFAFVEGALVKAVREGHWLLLDEVSPGVHLSDDPLRREEDSDRVAVIHKMPSCDPVQQMPCQARGWAHSCLCYLIYLC